MIVRQELKRLSLDAPLRVAAGDFVDAQDRAGLDDLWWAESAGEEKTLRDTARHLDSDDAAHVMLHTDKLRFFTLRKLQFVTVLSKMSDDPGSIAQQVMQRYEWAINRSTDKM